MLRFEITIRGSDAVRNELRGAVAKLGPKAQDVTYRWAQDTRATLKSTPYPPKRPGQRYVRTGRLASSWAATRAGKGAIITNSASGKSGVYAGYVVGDNRGEKQAWMHRGRWWTARSIIDRERPKLKAALMAEVERTFPLGTR